MRSTIPVATTLLASLCPAQLPPLVSPVQFASVAGTSSYAGPWYNVDRCQQLHGDLGGNPSTFTSLAWRRSGSSFPETNSAARTIDAEFFMADTVFANAQPVFASNYATPPVNVVIRKQINLPDWVQPQGSPAPWSFVVPLDQPFAWAGTLDLLWEVVVWANTRNSNYLTDAVAGLLSLPGAVVYTGVSCTATGSALPLVQTVLVEGWRAPDRTEATWSLQNGIPSTAAWLALGASNPNLQVPGFCAPFVTDALVVLANVTNAIGALTVGPSAFGFVPALVGMDLHSQFLVLDSARPGEPFAISHGAKVSMPDLPPPLPLVTTVRSNGNPSATTGYRLDYRGQIVRFGR